MRQGENTVNTYRFGEFRLDLDRQALFLESTPLDLRPKSFDVLRHLAQNPGRVISREELLDTVWGDLVVTDDSLTQCLIEIRRVLGDDDRSLIKTIPRRGYLFDATVEKDSATGSSSKPKKNETPSRWTLAALVVLAIAIGLTWWRIETQGPPNAATLPAHWQPPPASIAVLPFADMSEAGDRQYLAEGISEEILNLLAQSPDLTVIARTSSFQFRDAGQDIGTIARELNVAYVLEGSVRLDGDRVRVTAQLVEGDTEAHVWSQTFDDLLTDVFAMQDRVARAVAEVLEVKLTGRTSANQYTAYVPETEAWETYSRGRLYYHRRSEGDIIRAQASFEEALEIDPDFADAWVALSATYLQRFSNLNIPDEFRLSEEEALPLIESGLEKALAINPNHPEALWRLGALIIRSDPSRSLEMMARSIELGDNHAIVQGMMGGFMVARGHPEKALPILKRMARLDPLSAAYQSGLGHALYFLDRWSEAGQALGRAVELNPGGSNEQRAQLAWVSIARGDVANAATQAKTLPRGPNRELALAMLHHVNGETDLANEAIQRLAAFPAEESATHLARAYAMLGQSDEAFKWLNISFELTGSSPPNYRSRRDMVILEHSPFLTSVHQDERWTAWISAVAQWRYNETEEQIRRMIEQHVERHPELYENPIVRETSG